MRLRPRRVNGSDQKKAMSMECPALVMNAGERSMTTMARHLKILFVGAELAPFAKVGGLGEVLFALPRAMRGLGHDVRAVVPNYASVARKKYTVTVVAET